MGFLLFSLIVLAFLGVAYGAYLLGRTVEADDWAAHAYDPKGFGGVGRLPVAAGGELYYVITAAERLDMLAGPEPVVVTDTLVDVRVVNPLLTLPYPAALERPPQPILLGVV